MLTVSAVIPSWNNRSLLEQLLAGLRQQTYPVLEVLVIDNGSTDGADDAAEAAGARVIRLGGNRGFAHAVNRGVAEARGDVLAILNNDVAIEPGWLASLMSAFSDPGIWFCCGRLLMASDPARLDGSFDLVSRACCPWRAGWGRPAGSPGFTRSRDIDLAPMTATLFRRDLFARVGPIDERFESYLEDVDFGLRCASKHAKGRFVGHVFALHTGSGTLGRWHPDTVRRIARNMAWLVDKHLSPELRSRWRRPIRAGQLLWGLTALRHNAFGSWRAGRAEARAKPISYEGVPGIEAVLTRQEREILDLQRSDGWNLYWRMYSLLAGEL